MKVHSVNHLSRDGLWLDHEWESGPDDLSSETSSNESIRDMEVVSLERATCTKLPPIHSTTSTIKSSSLTDSISNIIHLTLPFISFRPPQLSNNDLSQLYLTVYSAYKANPPPMGLVLRLLQDETTQTSKLEVIDMEFVTLERLNITMLLLFELVIQKSISLIIIKGGDDRLQLNKQGVNKYLCSPVALPSGAIHRAYCTCSPPSSLGIAAASRLLKRIWLGEISTEKAGEEIRRDIRMHLHLSPEVEVVLHPSGTDAEITPLLAGLHLSKKLECDHVFNVLTASTEVGSQSSIAAAGKHISHITPSSNSCTKNALLNGFPATTVLEIPHRNPDGSLMTGYDEEVLKLIFNKDDECPNSFFIVHLVGSKTGLVRPSKSIVSKLKEKLGTRLLLVYDACQMRCDISEFKWYIAQGACILITGSKFYGGPSFCGAVLCPMYISHILKTTRPIIKDALCDYLTPSDACRKLWDILGIKPNTESNIGLLMRWECALAEMKSFSNVYKKVVPVISEWVRSAQELINSQSPYLRAYTEETNRNEYLGGSNTVVSIVCYDELGSSLNMDTMKKIHQLMTQDMSCELPSQSSDLERDVASIICYIGQPVAIGNLNVVRLALGAPVAKQMAEPLGLKRVLIEDSLILKKLSVLTKYINKINEHA